jgi:hypothetical protein
LHDPDAAREQRRQQVERRRGKREVDDSVDSREGRPLRSGTGPTGLDVEIDARSSNSGLGGPASPPAGRYAKGGAETPPSLSETDST